MILSNSVSRNSLSSKILKDEIYKMWYKQRLKNNYRPLEASDFLDEESIYIYRAYKIKKNCWMSFRCTTKMFEP